MVNFNVKNTSVLSNQEFVYMCQKYMRHKSEAVASQIKEIWQKMSTAEVANCLCLYGGEVHTGNLWELYFKTTEYKPFAKEVERVLLQKAVSENFVFLKIPHALSEENERKLLELNTNQVVYGLNLQVLSTSYNIFDNVSEAKNETERLIRNNSNKLKIMFLNLKTYLERIRLSSASFEYLVDRVSYNRMKLYPYFSRCYLKIALEVLAREYGKNALENLDLQLKLLDVLVWNKEDKISNRPFAQYALSHYNMDNTPSENAIRRFLKLNDVNVLREILAHSWLKNGKNLVLSVYPELKAEILLAETAYAAFIENSYEKKVAILPEYVSALLKNRKNCNLMHGKKINKVSMLVLCLQMYNTYSNCRYNSSERCKILQKAIDYCVFYNSNSLNKFIPLLQECAKEEKHRLYSL